MSDKSKIEWTDATWNPIVGCTKCSSGCINCYAEKMAQRQINMENKKYFGSAFNWKWTNRVKLYDPDLKKPLHWKKPRRIFVNSMSDTFHEKVNWSWITNILDVCNIADHHEYMFLTKRIDNAINYYSTKKRVFGNEYFKNIWFGISVCTQNEVNRDIPKLRTINAKVKFISIEPILEKIVLSHDVLSHLNWVIIGCETGSGARESRPEWITNIILQCASYDIPVFLKQIRINGKIIKNPNIGGERLNQFPKV